MADIKKKEPVKTEKEPVFYREQILASAWYAGRRDLLSALLQDGVAYTRKSVDGILKNYMKGQVE